MGKIKIVTGTLETALPTGKINEPAKIDPAIQSSFDDFTSGIEIQEPKVVATYRQALATKKLRNFETALTNFAKQGKEPNQNAPRAFDILHTILDYGLSVSGKLVNSIGRCVIECRFAEDLQKSEAVNMMAAVSFRESNLEQLSQQDFGRRESHRFVERVSKRGVGLS
jgi:hypothetical protein